MEERGRESERGGEREREGRGREKGWLYEELLSPLLSSVWV